MKKIGTKTIETQRLILRRFKPEDAEDMYKNWASDPDVTKFLTWPTHESIDTTKMILDSFISQYGEGDYFNWAIEYKNNNQTIGNISVVAINEKVDQAEIGYCMGKAYWGIGIMAEALSAVIEFLFYQADFNRIAAYHDTRNPNSGKVMSKAGMLFEGIHRNSKINNQGICDVAYYSILKSDREFGWHDVKTDEDIQELLSLYDNFEDSVLAKMEYVSGNVISDSDLSGALNMHNDVKLLFQRMDRNPYSIELMFTHAKRIGFFCINHEDNALADIMEAKICKNDKSIFWTVWMDFDPYKEEDLLPYYDATLIEGKELKWRIVKY